jgi:hypothetical protein
MELQVMEHSALFVMVKAGILVVFATVLEKTRIKKKIAF